MPSYTVLLVIFTFLAGCFCEDQNTLRKLQVVFRHGYRYPYSIFWTDNDACAASYKNSALIGNLTKLGKSQMSMLGYFIRVHYNTFSGLQKGDSVDLYSSNYTRDNESAALVYEGIFKNFGDTTKNIQLVNPSWDGPINTNDSYYGAWLNTSPIHGNYRGLMDYLKQYKPDKTEVTMMDLDDASDQMISEIAEGCNLPTWLNITIQEQFISLQDDVFASFTDCKNEQVVKENADAMIKQINAVFDPSKAANTKDVTLYALHDSNIAPVLSRLGIYNNMRVPFGAAIFFELHNTTSKRYEVRIFYDNSTDYTDLRQLELPGCGYNCSYDDFVKLATDRFNCNMGSQLQASLFIVIVSSFLFIFLVEWF